MGPYPCSSSYLRTSHHIRHRLASQLFSSTVRLSECGCGALYDRNHTLSDCLLILGKDEFIRVSTAGYVVAFGEMVYRALDAVERLRSEGVDVGLVNKATMNIVDKDAIRKYRSFSLRVSVLSH
jgi:transketolase C-terminal domain/subunit